MKTENIIERTKSTKTMGMFPVKKCITSYYPYYPSTFRVRKTASFWCSNFAAALRLWASRRHFAWWKIRAADSFVFVTIWNRQKDVFCCKSMTEYLLIWEHILSRSWNNAWGFPAFSSQETSMRFRRVGLQRDKNDKKNPSEKSVTHQKTKSSWAPLHLLEMCRISRWIFFSRIVDQENQEGDDATNAEILNLNKGKQKNRLEHVVLWVLPEKKMFFFKSYNNLIISRNHMFGCWFEVFILGTFSSYRKLCHSARDSRAGPRPMHCQSTARPRNTEKPVVYLCRIRI